MTRVLLINQEKVPHYRVPVYNYLSEFLQQRGFDITIAATGIQEGNGHQVRFACRELPLTFFSLLQYIRELDPDAVIFWVNLKYLCLFPILLATKALGKKVVYWGHGRDLLDPGARGKNMAYAFEQWLCDALILYAEHLKRHIPRAFHGKSFVANNTLNLTDGFAPPSREETLAKYGIRTKKNIICIGRIQRRKRIDHLLQAFKLIDNPEAGLVLVGPDPEGILRDSAGPRVAVLGPIYDDDKWAVLSAADVYCIPGAVGLGIVDAFHCGLPMVTEDGDESPEIMYLKDGVNGFIVPKGDVGQLARKLELLLENDELRDRFSSAARSEIASNGSIEIMCQGFADALQFVAGQRRQGA